MLLYVIAALFSLNTTMPTLLILPIPVESIWFCVITVPLFWLAVERPAEYMPYKARRM